MEHRRYLPLCLLLFLGVLLLAPQIQARVFNRNDTLVSLDPLESRGKISDFANKFRPAVKGKCRDDECDLYKPQGEQSSGPQQLPPPLTSTSRLEKLWNSVLDSEKVKTGVANAWELKPDKPGRYTTSIFYGCTIVMVVDGQGVFLGYFAEGRGDCPAMENEELANKEFIKPMEKYLPLVDFTDEAISFILRTSTPSTVGYRTIKNTLLKYGIPEENIHGKRYTRGLSETGHRGKALVDWSVKEGGGARMEVYIYSDEPTYVRDFDVDGNPCELLSQGD